MGGVLCGAYVSCTPWGLQQRCAGHVPTCSTPLCVSVCVCFYVYVSVYVCVCFLTRAPPLPCASLYPTSPLRSHQPRVRPMGGPALVRRGVRPAPARRLRPHLPAAVPPRALPALPAGGGRGLLLRRSAAEAAVRAPRVQLRGCVRSQAGVRAQVGAGWQRMGEEGGGRGSGWRDQGVSCQLKRGAGEGQGWLRKLMWGRGSGAFPSCTRCPATEAQRTACVRPPPLPTSTALPLG